MAVKTKRPFIKFDCDVCKRSNYHVPVSKGKSIENKISLSKFCKWCKKHTVHKMKIK